MNGDYNHKEIEKKWQEKWSQDGIYKVENSVPGKDNFFTNVEFSYPSGNLHVGHWYAFSVPDFYARYMRMRGYNVLYPVGFDSFGLPAENAAIKNNKDPKAWTTQNMEFMRGQLSSMGNMFDWDREIATSSPEYYKWTQWMFSEFFKNDLAYRASTKVNYCPSCKTILANEQVSNGECERCGSAVVQKNQDQWMLRISKFADDLIDDLDTLDWPNEIKTSQKSWIGRSEGSEIPFKLSTGEEVRVFTTRADTLYGVTYMVLAPDHELVHKLESTIQNMDEVKVYVEETQKKSELDRQQSKEKTGVKLEGLTATNPANGEEISVWIADYVLAGYGTGAVMAVPAHDERDYEFATKFGLPIVEVVVPSIEDTKNPHVDGWPIKERHNVHAVVYDPKKDAYLTLDWHNHDWKTIVLGGVDDGEDVIEAARREVLEETGYSKIEFKKLLGSQIQSLYGAAHKKVNRVSWSTGLYFELIDEGKQEVAEEEKEQFKVVWMPAKDFTAANLTNVEIPFWLDRVAGKEINFIEKGVLMNSGDFDGMTSVDAAKVITEKVGGEMKKTYRLRDWGISRQRYWGCPIPIVYDPEGKTHVVPAEHLPWILPDDVDHTPDGTAPLARSEELKKRTTDIFGEGWTPEVETMDTFVDSSWYFYRYLDSKNKNEFASMEAMDAWMPIDSYSGGAEHTTMHLLYSRFWTKALHSLGLVKDNEPYKKRYNRGLILGPDGNKMSKSKGNVIDPDGVVENVGSDTVRMYLAFMGPYGVTANYPWDPNGVVGIRRFIERVVRISEKLTDNPTPELESLVHKTIKKNGEDFERLKFNTAISNLMILTNAFEKSDAVNKDLYKMTVRLLAPMAPHISEELWRETLGEPESVHLQEWPKFEEAKTIDDEVTVVVQINGKVRTKLTVAAGSDESFVMEMVKIDENVQKFMTSEPKKIIYIQDKLLNIVV